MRLHIGTTTGELGSSTVSHEHCSRTALQFPALLKIYQFPAAEHQVHPPIFIS